VSDDLELESGIMIGETITTRPLLNLDPLSLNEVGIKRGLPPEDEADSNDDRAPAFSCRTSNNRCCLVKHKYNTIPRYHLYTLQYNNLLYLSNVLHALLDLNILTPQERIY
jgi:hypothetical protein